MAARSCALRLCLRFTYLLVICVVFDGKGCSLEAIHSNHIWNRAVEYNIALKAMKIGSYDGSLCIPVASRRLRVTKRDQNSIQNYTRLVKFGKQVALVNLLLLCNDIALNPGPVTSKLVCPVCSKTIRKNQGRLNCVSCKVWHHLKCSLENSESARICRLCTVLSPSTPLDGSVNETFLDEALAVGSLQGNLKDIVCTHGFKMLHLNVRSLNGKIDELRSTLSSGIHLLALSETWLSSDIMDSEIGIVGYKLYRADRKTRGGGVAVYVRDDICTIRRDDLESPDVESVWLQVNLPKSHAFLVGTFYRPPNSSKNYDGDFAINLDSMINSALAQTQSSEITLLGDFNCDLTVCHHLSPYQCGFRKNHSTETAAIAFTDSVRRNMDQGLLTGAVFIDLRKAFDTIDQSVLLNKLMKYGVNDLELEWFNNYLTCRSQVVCLGDVASEQCQLLYGVPQGSILGPLLFFVLFVNDLPSVFSKCQVLMYADDTVIYYASQTVVEIEQILTDELDCLHQWLQGNNLFLNNKKTECLLFGTAPRLSKVNDFTIMAGSSVLRHVVEFKY